MKKVFFIRHAKSSWNSEASRDIDRPLNKRGKRDAPLMASHLKSKIGSVDGIVKSPAQRITETVRPFIKAFEISNDHVLTQENLYGGGVFEMLEAIQVLPEDWNNIFIFGHNPGMTYAAHYFGGTNIENVPTCGIFEVQSETNDWADFRKENSTLVSFIYPKQFLRG
jgi:phosphohistidine phosphatase